jgi:hypothetical protein
LRMLQLALSWLPWIASRSGCSTRSMKPFMSAGMSPHQSGRVIPQAQCLLAYSLLYRRHVQRMPNILAAVARGAFWASGGVQGASEREKRGRAACLGQVNAAGRPYAALVNAEGCPCNQSLNSILLKHDF